MISDMNRLASLQSSAFGIIKESFPMGIMSEWNTHNTLEHDCDWQCKLSL